MPNHKFKLWLQVEHTWTDSEGQEQNENVNEPRNILEYENADLAIAAFNTVTTLSEKDLKITPWVVSGKY